MTKKSAAQLKRLMKRAEARGEIYEIPPPPQPTVQLSDPSNNEKQNVDSTSTPKVDNPNNEIDNIATSTGRLNAYEKYQKDIEEINANDALPAKERRSAKRKAVAIAMESCDCTTVDELLQWYETYGKKMVEEKKAKEEHINQKNMNKSYAESSNKKKTIPYILFIGQLSFDTTKEELFQHMKKQLESDHKITEESIQIRMLHDKNTNKSRGMAFVEIKSRDPELMYSCLKLHRTYLKGRRINVERSAGGGVETRASRIRQHRTEQEQYVDMTVNNMLEEYYQRGEIQRNEIDDGVLALCKRHSTTVVQAALERYVESNGRDMDNTSAYLSFLLTKLAEEGIYNNRDDKNKNNKDSSSKSSQKRQPPTNCNNNKERDGKRTKITSQSNNRGTFKNSELAKQGVDMSVSNPEPDLLKIFPSMSRGRGRGRGYM